MGEPLRIGMIGCGVISRQYLDTAKRLDAIEVVAAADLRPDRAAAVEARDGPRAMSVGRAARRRWRRPRPQLDDPAAHGEVALAAIAAGSPSTGRSRSHRRQTRRAPSSRPPRRPACAWAAHPTPSSAPGSRQHARRSTTAASAHRSAPPRRWSRRGMSGGIRTPTSTTSRAAVRSWTWGRTTSPRW